MAVGLESNVNTHCVGTAQRDIVSILLISADSEDVKVVISLVTLVLEYGEDVVHIHVEAYVGDCPNLLQEISGESVMQIRC